MSCPKCSADVPPESAFCNKCGASLGPARPLAAAGPSPAMEPEQELWKGRFSGKANGHWWILWCLAASALAFAWFRMPSEYRDGPYLKWAFLAAAGVPAVLIVWSSLVTKLSTRYRLTTYRLFVETGFLSRDLNEIELVRVDDVAVRQNLFQRIFNVGTITVIAPHDQTEPRLEIVGIENPIEVKEMIRNCVRRRRQGSLNVENL